MKKDSRHKYIRCCVLGCGKTRESAPELSFFAFPRDPDTYKSWIQVCSAKTVLKQQGPKICSAHFEDADMIPMTKGVRLKPRAVPKPVTAYITMHQAAEAGKASSAAQGKDSAQAGDLSKKDDNVPEAGKPSSAAQGKEPAQAADLLQKGGDVPEAGKIYSATQGKDSAQADDLSQKDGDVPEAGKPSSAAQEKDSAQTADLLQTNDAVEKPPMEFYLDVVVQKPKPSGTERNDIHSYAEQPDPVREWDANKENYDDHAPPPSPPPSDDDPGPVKKAYGSRATRAPAASAKGDTPEQPSLSLPYGELTRYLVEVRAKQQQICELQNSYNSLVAKVQFRNTHPDWSYDIPVPSLNSPLLTLRDGQLEQRDAPLEPVNSLRPDTLLPLAPNDAWYAIVALRKQVLDLQVALMYSRIQVKYREMRLQEVTADHRRYKATVRAKQRKADKEEQNRDMRIRQLERRCNVASSTCSQWRLKTKIAEKTGNKKKRRGELLTKGLTEMFTPMQLRVIRTGKKPRWGEEDIRRAIELKKLVTKRGYAFIRNTMKIPLPSPMIMRRGALRFEALKPLYEQMVAANLLKYSTKKKPKVTKKEDHVYQEETHEVATPVRRKKALPAGAEAESAEPAQPKPIRRRKKRPAAPPPPSMEVEFEALGAVERAFASSSAPAPKRPRTTWSNARPSWGTNRLWQAHGQAAEEYEQAVEERRPRQQRPTWSADTADFL